VTISDAGNAYGFFELGVVWIGKSLTLNPAENGFKYQLTDYSRVQENEFGHRYVDEYPTRASLEFTYSLLDYDDAQVLENAFRTNGVKKPVLVAIDPTGGVFDKDHLLVYGNFQGRFGLSHINYDLFNADSIRVEELS